MASCGATISLLPVSLSLVHIPRSRIQELIHPILRQTLLPGPTFLNVTCNEIELSVFAEHHALQDFEMTASRDARKLHSPSRERSDGSKYDKRKQSRKADWKPVEISQERWNVLQIDSHSGSTDSSGARIHELSAPLAAAGISILYQSSYMSDFIFVKEYRLAEVMSLLGSVGFDLYQSDPDNLTSQLSTLNSPILSPLGHLNDDDSSIHLFDLAAANPISPESGAVLTRSRSSTDASVSPSITRNVRLDGEATDESTTPQATPHLPKADKRSDSHSPSGSDVRVLDPDLTCIGLSDDNADVWGLKIIKLVAYPDLIPLPSGQASQRLPTGHGTTNRASSWSEDGILASVSELGIALMPSSDTICAPESDTDDADDTEHPNSTSDTESETTGSRSDSMTRVGDSPIERASSPIFELSPVRDEAEMGDDEGGSLYASPLNAVSDLPSDIDVPKRRPTLLHVNIDKTSSQGSSARRSTRRSRSQPSPPRPPPPLVPFFSFTRTPEGSSLTAPVDLLAALFPPSERHMVICSGELDVLDSRAGSPVQRDSEAYDDETQNDTDVPAEPLGTMKCLQIDLTKFGLDKHGLVNRYSRTLEDNGINHMYSSTYKTANLLVDKAYARRAQMLLRSC
ncbi:hypothetical protein BDW22DRAFT_1424955 [Trametopsis cervina]|nr:hypothetical protein BDW22DRAFT_1424955 [Trametopsis cervina]